MAKSETATLTTVARDVREVRGLLQAQSKTLSKHTSDIAELKDWKRGTEIATKAVEEYKRKETQDKMEGNKSTAYKNLAEVLKYVVPLVIALTALAYAYTNRIH